MRAALGTLIVLAAFACSAPPPDTADGVSASLARERSRRLSDVRYALLPNSTLPLWGISLDMAQQEKHVEFMTFRQHDGMRRQLFMDMLANRPLAKSAGSPP